MHNKKSKLIKIIKVFLFIISILIILTSCNKDKIWLIKNNENEIIYKVDKDNFIFKDINIDVERSRKIVDNCVEVFNKIRNEKYTYNDVDIIFSKNEDFNINSKEIEIPYSTLNDNISFEEIYIFGKIYSDNINKWINLGFSRQLLKKVGFIDNIVLREKEDVYSYVEENLNIKPYELSSKSFSVFSEDFLVKSELSAYYVEFLLNEHGEEEFFKYLKDNNQSENQINNEGKNKKKWLENMGFKISLKDDKYVFLLDNKYPRHLYEDFDKIIVIDNTEYYFSTSYTPEEDANAFVNNYYDDIEKMRKYFKDNEFILPNKNIKYKIISDAEQKKLYKNSMYIDLTNINSSHYIKEYADNYISSPVTSWLKHGMQSLLEEKFNSNYKLNEKITAEIILQNRDNHYLLTFDKDYFITGENITEQSEKAYVLAKSFVQFLEKHIGEKKLVELYTNEYDFEKITESTEKNLKIFWIESLNLDKDIIEGLNDPKIENLNIQEIREKFTFKLGYIYCETDNGQYYFEENYMTYKDMWSFIQIVEEGILNVKSYLGFYYEKGDEKIEYFIRLGEGNSFSTGNRITLYHVKDKKAEYLHETVHVLTGYDTSLFFSEGLATHLDILFTKWITPPAYGQNIDVLAKEIIALGDNEGLLKFNDYFFTQEADSAEHMKSYILAASFVKYIETTYGRKELLAIFDDINNVEIISKKTLEELKNDWILSFYNN